MESLVAISILVTGLVAVVSMTISNNTISQGVTNRLVAINLAREGVEAVRSIRDGNWLNGRTNLSGQANAWDTGLTSAGDFTAIAEVDPNTLLWTINFTPNSIADSAAQIKRNINRGLYRQSTNSLAGEINTPYRRILNLYAICFSSAPDYKRVSDNTAECADGYTKGGIRVIARVEWIEAGKVAGLEVEDWLYNWRYSYTPYVAP